MSKKHPKKRLFSPDYKFSGTFWSIESLKSFQVFQFSRSNVFLSNQMGLIKGFFSSEKSILLSEFI